MSNREGRVFVMQCNRKRLTAWSPFLLFKLKTFLSRSPGWENLLEYQLYITKSDEADTELGPLEVELKDALESLKVELFKVSVPSGVAPEWSKIQSDIDHVILVLEEQASEGASSVPDGRSDSKKLLAFFSDLNAAIGDKPRRDEGEELSDNVSIETYKRTANSERPNILSLAYSTLYSLLSWCPGSGSGDDD